MDSPVRAMRTIHFHLTEEIVARTNQYHEQTLALWRYLGMSVMPKAHCIEQHAIPLLVKHKGFANLGKDSGKRMHQVQSKLDQRLGAIRDFKKKEVCKSKEETMTSFPDVKIKMEEMFENKSRVRQLLMRNQGQQSVTKSLMGVKQCSNFPFELTIWY
jgi:hypothetical protein